MTTKLFIQRMLKNMSTKINKFDIILIIIIICISTIFILINNLNNKKGSYANVYYDNKLVKKIDLSINKSYNIKGYNGNVRIVVKNNQIKVDEENSPLHLCSKMGYISKSHESIICLPNKIVIEIEADKNIDTVVK